MIWTALLRVHNCTALPDLNPSSNADRRISVRYGLDRKTRCNCEPARRSQIIDEMSGGPGCERLFPGRLRVISCLYQTKAL